MPISDKVEADRQAIRKTNERASLTRRPIRSFVIRNGRVTAAQSDALSRLLPRFGLTYTDTETNLSELFGRQAPLWIEIGFGNGDALLHMAAQNPAINILGIEVHSAGIGHALLGIEKRQLSNVRIIQHDAMEVLENMIAADSIARVLLFFPDPWHKKRHHKRRIVQKDFTDSIARILMSGGLLHCATDWEDYAVWMMDQLDPDDRFSNTAGSGNKSERPSWRPDTRFEKRGQKLGHEVTDLIFERCAHA